MHARAGGRGAADLGLFVLGWLEVFVDLLDLLRQECRTAHDTTHAMQQATRRIRLLP
jgi:hypothetical protein